MQFFNRQHASSLAQQLGMIPSWSANTSLSNYDCTPEGSTRVREGWDD